MGGRSGCAIAAVLAILLPVSALTSYLALSFAFQTVHVLGSAMEPTVSSGEYLVAEKVPYHFHPPARGDIAVIRDPEDARRDVIKRVIGLPGERVLVSGCAVSVDGRRLAEPYVVGWSDCTRPWPGDGRAEELASDEYFVMGDNRDRSLDSRSFGPVKLGRVEALVRFRVLPLTRFGAIGG